MRARKHAWACEKTCVGLWQGNGKRKKSDPLRVLPGRASKSTTSVSTPVWHGFVAGAAHAALSQGQVVR